MASRLLAGAAVLWLAAAPCAGHDMWIEPVVAPVAVGTLVPVDVLVGHGGVAEPVRRNASRLLRFEAHGPSTSIDVPGLDRALPMGVFRPSEAGTWVVVYEGDAAPHRLDAERFERYLAEEGLEHVSEARRRLGRHDRPGTELYSRSLKTVLEVGDTGPARLADRRVGLPVELVLEAVTDDGLVVRLFVDGEPRAGALVDLRRPDEAEAAQAARTDADGRVRFAAWPGPWVAATVHMRAEAAREADWRTVFATTSFVVPGGRR